ncbi:hypothetical protein ACHAXS_014231 [Conticribra weissflogii]
MSRSRRSKRHNSKSQLSILPTIHEDKITVTHHPNGSWFFPSQGHTNKFWTRRRNRRYIYPHDQPQKIMRTKSYYLVLVVVFAASVFMRPYYLSPKTSSSSKPKMTISPTMQMQQYSNETSASHDDETGRAIAPLLYHISPGSTGSRTLYHAACQAGFPSVHHKSFCISPHRGIDGVAENVVEGVRAHFEVLRWYQIAEECCSLWSKGKVSLEDLDRNADENFDGSDGIQLPCLLPLDQWTQIIQYFLKLVVNSGIVGLFDTPYPYLATQVMEYADKGRISKPFVAMTERDPKSWAKSRSENHGLMVCRDEYSFEKLGSSEFDILGCIERAYHARTNATINADENLSSDPKKRKEPLTLHFWDVFEHRSHKDPLDPSFQGGMQRQMEHHQQLYLPLANYTPDFFGVKNKTNEVVINGTTSRPSLMSKKSRFDEEVVILDIRKLILQDAVGSLTTTTSTPLGHLKNNTVISLLQLWRDEYNKPLTCRGRVNWEKHNNSLVEIYHLPKTCGVSVSKAGKNRDKNYTHSLDVTPLIPTR